MPGKSPESRLWEHFRDTLRSQDKTCHAVRVENMLEEGYPDVDLCFAGADWHVELKRLPWWPKRPATIVRVTHYTQKQRDWLKKRLLAGGNVAVLLAVDKEAVPEYFLFTHGAVLLVGKMDRTTMHERAAGHWEGKINARQLGAILRGYR